MAATTVDALISGLLAGTVTGAMLRQDAPHFDGLPAADADRLRAHLLASFAAGGIPDDAIIPLAEELRTSASPVVLAGAARAVGGLSPTQAGTADWRALLTDAAARIAERDVFVRWQPGTIPPGWMRTAHGELLAARDGLPEASGLHALSTGPTIAVDRAVARAVDVEDQWGRHLDLERLLEGRTTLLAFFYTRCMNPQKCSLTVTRLAAIAARSATDRPQIVAVSYDPDFDDPRRLRRYGDDRGFAFSDSARLVRCVTGWQSLRGMLRLRVGYGPTTVNDHARELFRVAPDLVARGLDAEALVEEISAEPVDRGPVVRH